MTVETEIKRSPLVEQVIGRLRQQIESGKWQTGDKLPNESSLATEFGVGRSTIREAVRALAHAGWLEVRQGSGTYVSLPVLTTATFKDGLEERLKRARLLDIYEVRRTLEIEAARLAANRRTESDLARMERALELRQEARARQSLDDFLRADLEFHTAVVDAAYNPVLSDLFETFSLHLREALATIMTDEAYHLDLSWEHFELAEAIRAQDAAAAADATARHLEATIKVLRQADALS